MLMMCFIAATTILNMSNLEGEEVFDPSHLGQADEVIQERVSDDELIFIKGLVVLNSICVTYM